MEQEDLESPNLESADDFTYPIEDLHHKVFDKSADSLNVLDVYNIASSVGQEFERLTDAFGGAVFGGVMPKIIRILEILEILVGKREEENDELINLKAEVQNLQAESKLKDQKQTEEIEVVESSWKDETRDLLDSIKTLEEDNQRLVLLLTEKLEEANDNEVVPSVPSQQTATVAKLQEQIRKQNDELRSKNRLMEERSAEVDALHSQVQRLTKLNVDIRHKVTLLEHQGKSLIEERAQLEARINDKEKSVLELQMRSLNTTAPRTDNPAQTPAKREDASTMDNWPGDPLLANKLVIDLSDPNRPRYTLQELQEVLNDRNRLKVKCFLLEEELLYYKGVAKKYGYDESWEEVDAREVQDVKIVPHKNIHKPAERGIRRFFSYLTGDTSWARSEPAEDQPRDRVADDRQTLIAANVEKQLPGVVDSASAATSDDEEQSSEMQTISLSGDTP